MNFVCAPASELSAAHRSELAWYRYQVFVRRLGWTLRTPPDCEQDQFDGPDTVHIIARDANAQVVGCGRLLPTTGPYLLETIFPQLLNGVEIPRSEKVWELSRFASMTLPGSAPLPREARLAERILLQALRHCAAQGVTDLLAVSTPAVERLLLRAGVDCQRLGPPQIHAGQPVLAFVIAVNDASIAALAAIEREAVAACPPELPGRARPMPAFEHLARLALARAADAVTAVSLAPPRAMTDNHPESRVVA